MQNKLQVAHVKFQAHRNRRDILSRKLIDMSSRQIVLLLRQPTQRNWMGRPMYFSTVNRLLKEEPVKVSGEGLGKPSLGGQKKVKGLTKTNWNRPQRPQNNREAPNNGKRIAPRRDWTKPVDQHTEKHAGETHKLHERHVNKFSKQPPKRETQAQRSERKKREEELLALAKEEEKERQQIALRKAKQKAKEQAQKNQMKDVYIPEIINAANLSRVLGVRIGNI
jgi:translation initiation factor IF-2